VQNNNLANISFGYVSKKNDKLLADWYFHQKQQATKTINELALYDTYH